MLNCDKQNVMGILVNLLRTQSESRSPICLFKAIFEVFYFHISWLGLKI